MKPEKVVYAHYVKPISKSIVLGGNLIVYPLPDAETALSFSDKIRKAVSDAEVAAFDRGAEWAMARMRTVMGIREAKGE